jgi:hypothetical protein
VLDVPRVHRVLARDLLRELPPRDPVNRFLGDFGLYLTRRHAAIIARAVGAGDSATTRRVILGAA